ncbi:glycosyltransferase involved in cell wall biosynthesis [Paenibacillus castaneae]|uniref:glycosyltransferase n=1 Tax=Paenibacillus castaneae TaxID=474957 RepID=UPI000C9B7D6C|nr:glycosyltransferase [Paenibacillus castaneae]NIK79534.1 glycosyltransferase involved in cell wall biosynthesis [Paenibacillus castaneae]
MKVTVAICTHNRAKDTGEAIESVLAQSFDKEKIEIVVIDNRSTDHTAEVVLKLAKVHGSRIRYLLENKLGLSVARNRAIREARGEYILFLDDDALASRHWVRHIVNVFESDPLIGCVGGKIDPIWEAQEPKWIPEEHRSVFTILDYSSGVEEMPAPSIPYGANVAFRASLFRQIAPFREDLGRVGNNLLSSEESELIARLRKDYKVYYTPFASVQHKIAKERTTKKWFLKRIFWQGVSDAVKRQDRSALAVLKHSIRLMQALGSALISIFHFKKFIRQIVNICYRNGSLVGILRYNSRG